MKIENIAELRQMADRILHEAWMIQDAYEDDYASARESHRAAQIFQAILHATKMAKSC
jgi:hypothetical protein